MKRKGRFLLSCGVLAILGIALVFWIVWPRYNYTPTGDELYDRCSELVLKQYISNQQILGVLRLKNKHQNNQRQTESRYFSFDWSTALDWEDEFSDDPRYWRLMISAALLERTNRYSGIVPPEAPLDKKRYMSDDQIRAKLIERRILRRARYLSELDALGQSEPTMYSVLRFDRLVLEDEELALALIDDAIEADPENSYYYFVKSDLLLGLGETEQAWDLLVQGNSTPGNYYPIGFPRQECIAYGSASTNQDNQLAAVLMYAEHWEYSQNRISEPCDLAVVCCALGYPLEFADQQVVRASRLGQMDEVDRITQMAAACLAQLLIDSFSEDLIEMSAASMDEKKHINAMLSPLYDPDTQDATSATQPVAWGAALADPFRIHLVAENDYLQCFSELITQPNLVSEHNPLFDCLNPPPLARWAQGEATD